MGAHSGKCGLFPRFPGGRASPRAFSLLWAQQGPKHLPKLEGWSPALGHAPYMPLPIGWSPPVPPPSRYKVGGADWGPGLELELGSAARLWLNAPR